MKRTIIFATVLSAALASSGSGAYVTNLTVRQDWPWSGKVNIDFTLVADASSDIDMTATYDGGSIDLAKGGLTGTRYSVAPGDCHYEWDAAAAGFSSALANFRLNVSAVDASDRTYLVFDLSDGSHAFLADVPSGGWTDEYKTSKLVFRRIPSGTFTMGASDELRTFAGFTDTREKAHAVTISSDYYMAIFPLTKAQYNYIDSGSAGGDDTSAAWYSYDSLRGSVSSDSINWPRTGHRVAADKFIDKCRVRFGGAFLLDLPTEAMWERAAKAGGTGLFYPVVDGTLSFPNGGTKDELVEFTGPNTTGLLDAIAFWRMSGSDYSKPVGQKLPNPWGLYDTCGLVEEWCIDDGSSVTGQLSDETDPLGTSNASPTTRIRRGYCFALDGVPSKDTTIVRRVAWSANSARGIRLCIYLVPFVE